MNRYKGTKVLVTGGTGFIGSRLVERLSFEEGAEITVLVNTWAKATWVSRLPVTLVKGSINSIDDLSEAMKSCSVVFHCVGLGGTPEEALRINVEGTRMVLEAAHQQGVNRVIFFSSAVVHGPATAEGMNELSPYLKTGDAYAESKIEAEKLFWKKTAELDIEGVILRPTYVWGPNSQYYTIDFINQMKNKSFTWVDDGHGLCNAAYVDNVVDVALLAGKHPNAPGETFLVADGEKLSWRDFYGYYASMVGYSLNEAASAFSKPTLPIKTAYGLKRLLIYKRDLLTSISDKLEPYSRPLTRLLVKAPRKLVKMALKSLDRKYPAVPEWDLEAYGSKGKIDLSRMKDVLGYTPRTSVEEGMRESEIWLRDQNHL